MTDSETLKRRAMAAVTLPTYIGKDGLVRVYDDNDPVWIPKACIRPVTVSDFRVKALFEWLERPHESDHDPDQEVSP